MILKSKLRNTQTPKHIIIIHRPYTLLLLAEEPQLAVVSAISNADPVIVHRDILSGVPDALQLDRGPVALVHLEGAVLSAVASSIQLVSMDAQVLSSLGALQHDLVSALSFHLPLRQVALATLHHDLIVSGVHADRVETLEIAILSVLDNHRIIHLELVRILEMLTTLVLVLSSSSSALSIAEHLELTEIPSSASVDALLRPKRQVLSGLRRL